MTNGMADLQPDPSTQLVIRISTVVLFLSLAFLAWVDWRSCMPRNRVRQYHES